MKQAEKIMNKRTDYTCPIFNVETLNIEFEDGKEALRNVVRHKGAVCVVPFKDKDTVLMVEQYRVALDSYMIEFPAGKLESDEEPMKCCIRELEEETSYTSDDITYLGKIATSAGFCDEIIHIYKAENLKEGKDNLGDEDEFISLHEVSLDMLKDWIKIGKIIDAKSIAAFGMLEV